MHEVLALIYLSLRFSIRLLEFGMHESLPAFPSFQTAVGVFSRTWALPGATNSVSYFQSKIVVLIFPFQGLLQIYDITAFTKNCQGLGAGTQTGASKDLRVRPQESRAPCQKCNVCRLLIDKIVVNPLISKELFSMPEPTAD